MSTNFEVYTRAYTSILWMTPIDLIINFALKTKRLLKKVDKDDTGVT